VHNRIFISITFGLLKGEYRWGFNTTWHFMWSNCS